MLISYWSSDVCSSDLRLHSPGMNNIPYKHLYLVDGSGYIFRAYFAIPPRNASDGTPTNATFGFTNMLVKLLRESDADAIAVIFDASAKTFRNDIYPQYKAHRPEPPEDLIPQFAAIRDATRAFNLPCVELAGYEARSEEHTSELQSLMRSSYAVF